MSIVLAIPFLAYLLVLFNILAFVGVNLTKAYQILTLPSGAVFLMSISDLMIILGVIALFFEIFKSTRTSIASILDHTLSLVVLVIFVIEFFVVKKAGTSSFLILMLMSMFDVVSGFTVTISTARRDVAFDRTAV